jgi:hypothetical protein
MIRGSYRHLITLHRPDTYDVANEIESWKQVAQLRCRVRTLETTEGSGGDRQGTELNEFRMPYVKSVELDHRDMIILFRGREFEVLGVKNLNYLDKELVITAKHDDFSKRMS